MGRLPRYNNDRYSNREPRAVDAVLPVPPGAAQYDANPAYRRYNQYDVAPPGTGPDIPGIGSYEKAHYDRGYDRTSTHENRPASTEYLTPPGVDMRSDYAGRECDVAMQSFREKGVPPARDRESVVTSVLRDARDVSSVGRDNWDRGREMDHIASRDRDVDRERNKDYYEADYRHTYESKSYTYNSPDRKRRHSASPSRRGGSRDHYSNSEQHRHGRSDGRRKGSQRDGGKENRHTLQQPVEALDVTGDRDRNLDKDKESQKRERVLVEVRKEPSVDKEKGKKEKDEKVRKDDDDKSKDKKVKDKKKKKKEKDVDGEKIKKKKRKERKDGKKDSADGKVSTNEKARNEGQIQGKVAKKDVQSAAKPPATTDPVATKAAQPISVVIGEKKTKAPIIQHPESVVDALYGDMEDTRIDDALVASYGKVDVVAEGDAVKIEKSESVNNAQAVIEIKDESIEIVQTEEQKVESLDSAKLNVVLAPLPEPSKWELDDELGDEKVVEDHLGGGEDGIDKSGNKVVTSEVLKRAENAIFQKAINAIRPIEPSKKPAVGERKVYAATEKEKKIPVEPTVIDTIDITRKTTEKEAREARKTANSIQITIPIAGHVERSVELSTLESAAARKEKPKLDRSKFGTGPSILTANQWGEVPDGTSPHRVPVKERLGAKVDTDMDKRREEGEREEKSRRQRHRSRSNSREHKQHGSRKGLNLKSAIERKRTVSRSRSRSPYHRKIIADRKYLEPLKYVDPLVAAMELRYMEPADRRYLDPSLERKYMEHGLRRDPRYPEGDRRLIERDIRRPEKHYESERRRDRSPSDSHEREWARTKTREGREHSRHKVKKRTKNRSESHSRKKSTSDRETKRSKKKEKKHKKEKVKKHKAKADKEEKKELENVKVDEKNEPTAEGKLVPENQVSETAKEKPKQITTLETEETGESKEKSKKGSRKNPRLASDRKKSTLDEASFEPDYDLSSSGESEVEDVPADGDKKQEDIEKKAETQSDDKALSPKKRDRSASAEVSAASALADKKRQKLEKDVEKSGEPDTKKSSKVAGGKVSKKRDKLSSSDDDSSDDSSDESDSSSGSSSSSDDDSSDGSSIRRRKKKRSSRRHRRKKGKRSRRAETSSDSDSDSDSDDASSSDTGGARRRGRSTKKHKHHSKRSSKKKKKAKHR